MIIEFKYNGGCLCTLAEKFNTTVEKIAKLNDIDNVTALKKGEIILIEVKENG